MTLYDFARRSGIFCISSKNPDADSFLLYIYALLFS